MFHLSSAAVAVAVTAAFTALGGVAAYAAPTHFAQQGPSATPTPSPDHHDAMAGLDHDDPMAGMDHDDPMAGMDHDDPMAGMDHDDPMPGMDHDDPMAGMDHDDPAEPGGHGTRHEPADAGDPDSSTSPHSHSGSDTPGTPRPQGLVLGGFAAVNGGVLIAAGILRRREKPRSGRTRSVRPAK